MATPTFVPQALDFSGIERGIARKEARGIRAENVARDESIREEQRADRQVQQGFQALGVQQRQQGIDLQTQQLAAQVDARTQEQAFRQEQADLDREQQESAAILRDTLAVGNVMLQQEGLTSGSKKQILQTIFDQTDGVFDGVDLNTIDLDAGIKRMGSLFKNFDDEKINEKQFLLGSQMLASEFRDSAAIQAGVDTAKTIFTQKQQSDRTSLAAGGDAKQIPQYTSIINTIGNRLNEINEETGQPFLAIGSEARLKQQARLEAYEDLRDKASGIDISSRVRPPLAKPTPAPVAQAPQPIGVPSYLSGADQRKVNFFNNMVSINKGKIPSEEQFNIALKEGEKILAEANRAQVEASKPPVKQAEFIKTRSKEEQDFYTLLVRGSGVIPSEKEFDIEYQKSLKRFGKDKGFQDKLQSGAEAIRKQTHNRRKGD